MSYGRPPVGPTAAEILFGAPFWALGWCFGLGRFVDRRRVRAVSDNPVFWREVSRPMLAKPWQRITATAITLGVLALVYLTLAGNRDLDDADAQFGFAFVFAGVAWLLVGVLSATAVAGEKESDTWTLLLAAPVTGWQVVFGKAAGLCRRLLWPVVLVAVHFALFAAAGVIHPASVVLVLWVILTFNSVWLATGLYLSLRMRRATFAVIANLLLGVLAYALPPALLFMFGNLMDADRRLAQHGCWHIPILYLGSGMEGLNSHWRHDEYFLPGDDYGKTTAATFFTAAFVVGCLHLLVAGLILSSVASHFDRLVGRAGRESHHGAFDTDAAVIPAESVVYAPVWRRAVALLADELILRFAGVVLGGVMGLVTFLVQNEREYGRRPEDVMSTCMALGVAASFVLGWPYYALFESSRARATPGKAAMGLFVADADGRRASFLRASGRYFAKVVWGLAAGVGFLVAPFDPRRRAMHDRWAGTVVMDRRARAERAGTAGGFPVVQREARHES